MESRWAEVDDVHLLTLVDVLWVRDEEEILWGFNGGGGHGGGRNIGGGCCVQGGRWLWLGVHLQ